MTKVKWIESINPNKLPECYLNENLSDFDKHYEGTIIDTYKSFFGKLYLVVACCDGKIREVEDYKVLIITQ